MDGEGIGRVKCILIIKYHPYCTQMGARGTLCIVKRKLGSQVRMLTQFVLLSFSILLLMDCFIWKKNKGNRKYLGHGTLVEKIHFLQTSQVC